ncbi:hypothetical protein GCM10027020_22750 [Nocardioides salsibiostraticola]
MANPDAAYGPEALLAAIEAKEHSSRPRDRRVAMLRHCALLIGLGVAFVGVVVIAGWFLGLDRVTTLGAEFASMKLTTAASFAGVGVALAVAARPASPARSRVIVILAVLGGAYAALTILEYVVGFDAGLDNPFGLDTDSIEHPGRMSLATAGGMLLLWLALAALMRSATRLAQSLALACLGLGVVTLLGYSYDVNALYEFGPFSSTALHTAVGLAVAATGVLLLRAGDGLMSILTGNTAGGIIVRWMAPLAVFSPMVVGAVIRLGLGNHYSGPVALALFATIMATLGGAMILYGGGRLRNVDLRRAGAEETLQVARDAIAARDIMAAELGAAERRTREILDSAAEAYLATTLDGVALEWNDAATAMFGWTREEIIGVQVRDLIVSATESQRVRSLMRIDEPEEVQSEEPVLGRQVPLAGRRKSGGHLDIEVTTWRLGDGDDTVLHSLMTDVTARRRAEKELRLALDDIGDFSAAMAHDLKGPLTVVKGYSQLLEKKIDDQMLVELTSRITAAADRGMHLIDDILAFAEIGARRRTEDLIDLTALVREVAADERARVERPSTVEVLDLPDVVGDESLLRQLLSNLIGNALKYVPEDQDPVVSIEAEVDAERGTFDLRISDNGNPIATADLELIFTMFGRGTNTEGRQGTGVGLAICRRVAELHDGSIAIEATESGNCFVTTLPAVPSPEETQAREPDPAR